MKSSLKNMVLVLGGITAIVALLVALVNDMTKDAIALSNENAKNTAKFNVVNTSATEARIARDTTFTIGDFNITASTVVAANDNSVIGYAVEAPSLAKPGYAGYITLMVGFVEQDGHTVVSGVEVLSQSETPGLGANMTNPGNSLELSILGKDPESLIFKVTKDSADGSFVALTGSTISSRAYARAVETAYAGYLAALGLLDTSAEALESATPTGSTATSYTGDEATLSDAELTATPENLNPEQDNIQSEPEAQEGEISNE